MFLRTLLLVASCVGPATAPLIAQDAPFGSDFPHGEGLAEPRQYVAAQLGGLADDQVEAIMSGNLARFLGL